MSKQASSSTPLGRSKGKVFYMHTIGGLPAVYVPGQQICYLNRYGKWSVSTLAHSLEQIKSEQKASYAWRKGQRYDSSSKDYGYAKVKLP